jgi:hypothetical protein
MEWHIALMAALTGYLLGSVSFARVLMKVIAPEGELLGLEFVDSTGEWRRIGHHRRFVDGEGYGLAPFGVDHPVGDGVLQSSGPVLWHLSRDTASRLNPIDSLRYE